MMMTERGVGPRDGMATVQEQPTSSGDAERLPDGVCDGLDPEAGAVGAAAADAVMMTEPAAGGGGPAADTTPRASSASGGSSAIKLEAGDPLAAAGMATPSSSPLFMRVLPGAAAPLMCQAAPQPSPVFIQTNSQIPNVCGSCGTRETPGCWRRGWPLDESESLFLNLCNKCGLRYKAGRLGPGGAVPKQRTLRDAAAIATAAMAAMRQAAAMQPCTGPPMAGLPVISLQQEEVPASSAHAAAQALVSCSGSPARQLVACTGPSQQLVETAAEQAAPELPLAGERAQSTGTEDTMDIDMAQTLLQLHGNSLGAGQLPAAGTSGQPVAEGAALHTQQDAAAPMAPGGTRKRARSDSTPGQAKAPAAKGSPTGSSKKAAGEGRHKATVLQTLQAQASARLQAAQLPQQAGAMAGPAATWPHLLSHPCSSWSLAHVRTWLEGQGCGAVVDLFEAQQMDGAALKGLMRVVGGDGAKLLAVLAEVGVQPMGQRLRLADCLLQLFEL